MPGTPRNIYEENVLKYQLESDKLSRQLSLISFIRLVVFITGVTLIIFLANQHRIILTVTVILIFLTAFIALVKTHNTFSYRKRHATFLKEINQNELKRMDNSLNDFESCKDYISNDHSFSGDLDIFGSHSLFQLLDRTTSLPGRQRLAEWLKVPASNEEIMKRQSAVKELMPLIDFRQDIMATGMHFKNNSGDLNTLLRWIQEPPVLQKPGNISGVMASILALITTSVFVFFVLNFLLTGNFAYSGLFGILLLVNILVLGKYGKIAERITDDLFENKKTLENYRSLIVKIVSREFKSENLRKILSVFEFDGYSASRQIGKMVKMLDLFIQRGSKKDKIPAQVIYWVMNIFWLVDIFCIRAIERWKIRNRDYIGQWSEAISEFEAYLSIAGYGYSNPSFTFPEIAEEPFSLKFTELGHPLIYSGNRICNDFELSGSGSIAMITGSNMAGKSTFLRTVGINLVLAYTGAPCCAGFARVSIMKIFTSMRTQDNLETGISSFYAELKRVEQLLDLIKAGDPVFFLLDEMFKGTNSEDRHKGGYSLIRQLKEMNAFGIISTHDLELAKIFESGKGVINYSFNSSIRDHEISFDYKLTEGICTDFNASELMRKSGIKIIEE